MGTIPEGMNTVTPTLVVEGASQALELYKKAFGAEEIYRMNVPGTEKIMHAGFKIGDSTLFICDPMPSMDCLPSQNLYFYLYFTDADAAMQKAVTAGMTEKQPATDMFWGDRMGTVTDPFGVKWNLGTHIRDVSPEEMEAAMKQFAAA